VEGIKAFSANERKTCQYFIACFWHLAQRINNPLLTLYNLKKNKKKKVTCISHTPAPDVTTTVASFRTWRSLQLIVAGEPMQVTGGIMLILGSAFNLLFKI